MKAARRLAGLYALLCLAALALVPANARGWFGMEPDPLSGLYAIVLALPWSLILARPPGLSVTAGVLLIVLGMAANAALILWIGTRFRRPKTPLGD